MTISGTESIRRWPLTSLSGIDQLKKILRLTGTPDSSLVDRMQSKDVSSDPLTIQGTPVEIFCFCLTLCCTQAQSYVLGLPAQKKKNFKEVFTTMDKNGEVRVLLWPRCAVSVLSVTVVLLHPAVDLLEGMLLLDPERRLTAKQGLSHPYLAEYHDLESEPDSDPYDDSFESLELAVGEWKSECAVGEFIQKVSQGAIGTHV